MATHSSIFAWKIPGTEKLGRLQSMGSQKSWTQQSHTHAHTVFSESRMRLVVLQSLINYSVANPLSLEREPQNTCYR